MERCAAPRLHRPDPVTSTDRASEDAEEADEDVYECRICGFKATNVKCLGQHLQSAHPVTSLPDSRREAREEEHEGDEDETSSFKDVLGSESSVKEQPVPLGRPRSASLHSPDDSKDAASSTEVQEPDGRAEGSPVPMGMSSSSPGSSREKSHCSSGSKHASHKRHPVTAGTSIHNHANLVCLPLVSEGLKLVWVRSEQIHELDDMSDLVEAFNTFPYPTRQEASALARKCALTPDRVKAWFMMQRVRYGISWGEEDIQETRRKLGHTHKGIEPVECEEVDDEEDERSLDEMQQVFKHPPVAEACVEQTEHTHKPNHTVTQHTALMSDRLRLQYNNVTALPNNHGQQILDSNAVFRNGCEPLSQVSQMNSPSGRNVPPPHNVGIQAFDGYGQSPYMIMNDQHTAVQYLSGPNTLPQPFQSFPGKKSKAQLMALRRSFVRKSWPSDAEVQRIQRTTGLSCREIRKWFADSRYQLRRNGRAWLTKLTNRETQDGLNNDSLPGGNNEFEVDESEAQFELDVGVEDNEGAVHQSNESRQEISDDGEFDDSKSSIQQYSADGSPSSPPLSFRHSRVEPHVRLRKKTREQLEILRQNFLCCQWPTSDDYLILQQKTGLTKTEIIQWYGDTRYHVKHNQMRWMTSQERLRIIAAITQQQKKSGKYMRGRLLLEGMGSGLGDSAFINGKGSGEPTTWNALFSGGTPVLPEGKL